MLETKTYRVKVLSRNSPFSDERAMPFHPIVTTCHYYAGTWFQILFREINSLFGFIERD